MGYEAKGTCRKCKKTFRVRLGGGFCFHLLLCDKCGKAKSLRFDKLGDIHARYLKGLDAPYAMATRRADEPVLAAGAHKPLSQGAYHRGVERIAGLCKCGGQYRFKARPRCPECRSASIVFGDIDRFYD